PTHRIRPSAASSAHGERVAGPTATCGWATANLPLPVKRVVPSLISPNDTGRREPPSEERCTDGEEVEGRPLTDAELIDAARRGDVAAYGGVVRRYEQLAFRTAFLLCGDADEAKDAAQEGFARAYGALRRFRAGAEPRPWLLRIVANAARNRRRAAGRRASLALRSAQDRPSDGAAPSPEAAVLAGEQRAELMAAID